MYKIKKKFEISSAHYLQLDYDSKCKNLHGHNWIVWVYCKSKELNRNGMIIDFSEIKSFLQKLDHLNLNAILDFNPTAEHLALFICKNIPFCYKVEIQESEGNIASYEEDEE